MPHPNVTGPVYFPPMNKSNYLRALSQKDLSAIRRALLNERILKRASGRWPAIAPEGVDGNAGGEQQSAADGVPGIGADRAGDDVQRGEDE